MKEGLYWVAVHGCCGQGLDARVVFRPGEGWLLPSNPVSYRVTDPEPRWTMEEIVLEEGDIVAHFSQRMGESAVLDVARVAGDQLVNVNDERVHGLVMSHVAALDL